MKTIWKFPMTPTDISVIAMPRGAQVLCVQTQNGTPCLWALVTTTAPEVHRKFRTYGTGHKHDAIEGRYIGTYQLSDGLLVFHVFEDAQ